MTKKSLGKHKMNNSKANEPQLTFGGANIQFFSSLQEENEATFKYMAERTPEESLQAAYLIITAMYRKELENNEKPYTNITFIYVGLRYQKTTYPKGIPMEKETHPGIC